MPLSAQAILDTKPHEARSLFSKSPADIAKALSKLAACWHPDTCADPGATDVFTHILSMRDYAKGKSDLGAGTAGPGAASGVIFETQDGRRIRVRPMSIHSVDQGEILVSAHSLTTVYAPGFADLAEREMNVGADFKFADDKMKAQMAPSMPEFVRSEPLADGRILVIVRRGESEILLSDLLAATGSMPDVHAAWLCSGLLNIAAWLEYSGLVHGAISPETVLIDPGKHSVRLAAGWGFATKSGARPVALPGRTLDVMPRLALAGQSVDSGCDLELIRQTVREAIGDPRGTNGAVFKLPSAVATWLNMSPPSRAVEDYAAWHKSLEAGWGKRRFVDYPVRSDRVYAGGK
jgi:hypothetical protein